MELSLTGAALILLSPTGTALTSLAQWDSPDFA